MNFVLFYRDIAKEVSEINLKINFAQRFNRTMNGKHDVIELISLHMKFENMNLFLTKCNLITKKKFEINEREFDFIHSTIITYGSIFRMLKLIFWEN